MSSFSTNNSKLFVRSCRFRINQHFSFFSTNQLNDKWYLISIKFKSTIWWTSWTIWWTSKSRKSSIFKTINFKSSWIVSMNKLRDCIRKCMNLHLRHLLHFSASSATSASFASFASFAHQDSERSNFQLASVWESITRNQEDRDFERLVDSRRSRLLFDMNDDENSLAFVASITSKLRFEDVNFFDSNYQEKNKKIVNHFAFASVVNANKHVFYRDVYVFTNKLLDLVKQHDNETIENVIIVCFRNIALMWYSMKIDDFLRNLFRDAKLNIWCTALIDRFRTRSSIALIQLTIQFYFLNEIKQNITFRQWFQRMLHYVKVAKLNSIYNQFTLIWNRFHYIFRRDLSKSKVFIIVQRFLEDIDAKIFIWYEMIDRQADRQISYRQQQFFNVFSHRQQYINRDDHNDNIKTQSKTFVDDKSRQIYLVEIVQNAFYEYHLKKIENEKFDEDEMSVN